MIRPCESFAIFAVLAVCCFAAAAHTGIPVNAEFAAPEASLSEAAQAEISASGKLNINLARAEQLSEELDISQRLATRIVAYRAEHGDFLSTDELMFVSGMGEKTFSKISPLITV